MSAAAAPARAWGKWAALAAGIVATVALLSQGVTGWVLGAALAVLWTGALAATRPLVAADRHTGLYFAYGVMAFLVFFVLETYGFEGKVRTFPLIVGYAGLVLSALDIISLTDTRLGRAVTRLCGAALDESESMARPVRRELAVFAAMGGAVLGIYLLGFLIAGPLFVAAWVWLGGRTRAATAGYVGLGTFVFVYVLFELVLSYELFRGVLILPFFE